MTDLEVGAIPADVSVLVQDDLDIGPLVTHVAGAGGGEADVSLHRVHYLSTLDHDFSL